MLIKSKFGHTIIPLVNQRVKLLTNLSLSFGVTSKFKKYVDQMVIEETGII